MRTFTITYHDDTTETVHGDDLDMVYIDGPTWEWVDPDVHVGELAALEKEHGISPIRDRHERQVLPEHLRPQRAVIDRILADGEVVWAKERRTVKYITEH